MFTRKLTYKRSLRAVVELGQERFKIHDGNVKLQPLPHNSGCYIFFFPKHCSNTVKNHFGYICGIHVALRRNVDTIFP